MMQIPDPLTEILETFPLQFAYAGRFELTAPWGLSVDERSAAVFVVLGGGCQLTDAANGRSSPVAPGDVIVLSSRCSHGLRDAPASPVVAIETLIDIARVQPGRVLASGGGGEQTALLGGVIRFDGVRLHPVSTFLPPVVHLKAGEQAQAILVDEIVRLVDRELTTGLPGSRGIVDRLVEVLFIQAARVHLVETDGMSESSIGGMLHSDLGVALALIHREPEKAWTVAQLAERATMSRSAFSATFARVLGQPPLQYLRERRMQLACRLLRDPSLGLKEVASRVGYDSVSAFSSAFKRFSSAAPGDYRRRETLA